MRSRLSSLFALALAATPSLTTEALAAAPRYKMVLGADSPEHGVKTVSMVQNPAIQRGWVALSAVATTAKLVHLSTATEGPQKQVLTGPALLPGQEILRLDAQGNPFYITFDAATIEAAMYRFAEQGLHGSTNQDHSIALQGNTVVESWIVRDPARDVSAVLGITDVPAGTWMMSVRIPDEAYWLSEITTGNKTGFSIEGLFDSEQLTLAAVVATPSPVKKNWFTALTAMLLSLSGEKAAEIKVALGMETLADGRMVHVDDTTMMVHTVDEQGQPNGPLPDGEYDLQNGGKLVVKAGMRADGETAAAVDTPVAAAAGTPPPPATPAAGAAPAEPTVSAAPLADTAGLPDVVKAVNEILAFIKKDSTEDTQEGASRAPAAQKMAAQLHGVQVCALKLDAIELDGGDTLTLNPVSKKLTDAKGGLVESGYYKAADGSYFQVSTDQYFWSIDKQTYDAVYSAKLMAVELADTKAKLAAAPGGQRIALSGDKADEQPKTPAQLRLARAEATR